METFIWGHAAPVPEDVLRDASKRLDSVIAADGTIATEEVNEDVRAIVWRNSAWIKFFRVFLERSDTAKGKPMRQVLVVLTTLLIQAGDDSESSSIKNGILNDLFDILFEQSSHSKAKPALQALSHFLVSKLFTVCMLLDVFRDWNQRHAPSQDLVPQASDHTQLFLRRLFNCITRNDLAPAAGHLVVTLLDKGRQQQEELVHHSELYPVWAQPLRSAVGEAPESVPEFKNHLFPGLFKLSFNDYSQRRGSEYEDSDVALLFAALQAGKEIGLVQEVDYRTSKSVETCDGIIKIPDKLIGRLLAHSSSGPFLDKAERSMQLSGRADHADGVARSYELLYEQSAKEKRSGFRGPVRSEGQSLRYSIVSRLVEGVEQAIDVVNQDLSKAVNEHPVHGMLASLKYILDRPDFYPSIESSSAKASTDWHELHQRLFRCLHDIWASVRDVLCNDAPEGYVPEDVQEDVETTTKDVLSYAWRALKEASALMRVIITKATFGNNRVTAILSVKDIENIGKLCFVQLAELRHRGAFSTVAQTFASCCLRCSRTDDSAVQRLPIVWYEDALRCIRHKGFTITRRSAGMPALITGVLSADPEGPLFRRAMDDLRAEAQLEGRQANIQETHLPQVHAMNCLKDIYTNTKLGQSSEPYLTSGLDLAASRLESDVWAIRNCGLMLFRALIDRLLGSGDTQNWTEHDSSKASRLSYERYPNLLEIMTRLLRPRPTEQEGKNAEARSTASPSAVAEGVFPVLQILQRAPPPPAQARTIRQLVLGLTRSPHWHVRDMAARTYAGLVPPAEHRAIVLALLTNSSLSSQNMLHGDLLCVRYIVRRVVQKAPLEDQGILQHILSALRGRYEDLFEQNRCPFTAAVFLEILNDIGEAVLAECRLSRMPPTDKENDISKSHSAMPFDGPTRQLAESFMHQAYRVRSGKRIRSNSGPESSLFRRAAARNLALCFIMVLYSTALTQPSGANPAVRDLRHFISDSAETDADSCCAVVEYLGKILTHREDARLSAMAQHIATLFSNVLKTIKNNEVKAVVQTVLADLIESVGLHRLPLTPAKDTGRDSSSAPRTNRIEAPSLYESSLRLQGPFLDSKLQAQAQWTTELADETQRFAFPIRYAAVSSLNSIRYVWGTPDPSHHTASALLNLMLVTYDALNDDDDEIRDVATKVVTRIIAGPRYRDGMADVVPLVASQRLAEYLAKTYPGSRDLCEEAVHRVMGSVSPLDVLQQTQKDSTVLFVQEKQNLFIDDVKEVVIWSRVLKSLSDEAVMRGRAAYFSKWIWSGLNVFMDAAKAERDVEGRRSRKGSFEGSRVRRLLREFADVGEASEVHELWLERIEAVLADSVVQRLGVVKAKLRELVENVC
ncbi:hypothetical protein H2199_006537 [Coniosporium tulheliwenetii]|uniref:Uncharacterized protein n=1 Tax=Coniosporium tulheliwenetii TaxID=3383036 RepID=A0ACC2YWV5_9PEZI|nr:hypothetical protein H2199_006537 [Cladosporium sp. JES 115]